VKRKVRVGTKATPSRAARPDAAERRAFYEALQELVRIYQFRDRDRACYGAVSAHECYALEAIDRAGALGVGALAQALGLHKSNASRLAGALEAKGFVRREPNSDDGRGVRLQLTAAGRRTHDAIRAKVEARQAGILAGFPPAVRRAFVRLLGELAADASVRVGTPAR
jgi:MarR family 2-MHQ and catechol resistance regulon transcriptional repressor